MPRFAYKWIDAEGKKRSAVAEASSMKELEGLLLEQGVALLEMHATGSNLANDRAAGTKRRRKVSRRDLIELCIFAGTLCEAGLSITTALRDFAAETGNNYFRSVLEGMATSVESGETLASSMAHHPDIFKTEFVAVVRAGEKSGRLPESFAEIKSWLEWQERIAGDIRQATTYPLVVSILLSLFVLYLFSSVVPKIASILETMHVAMPFVTRMVLGISHMATKTWWLWLGLFVGVPIAIRELIRRIPRFADWWDGILLRLPVLGELNSMGAQSRFAQNFAVLHRAGISILENLELCSALVGNRRFSRSLGFALRDVEEGGSLAASLRKSGLFSPLSLRMLAAGEQSGDLEKALGNVARYYNEELPRRIKRAFALLEPALIVVLVAVIGTVALAIFLPILSLGSGIRK
jgi:type IV pilus assembly protein PilC